MDLDSNGSVGLDSDPVSGPKKAKMVYYKGETSKIHGFSILKDWRLFPEARKSSQRRNRLKIHLDGQVYYELTDGAGNCNTALPHV